MTERWCDGVVVLVMFPCELVQLHNDIWLTRKPPGDIYRLSLQHSLPSCITTVFSPHTTQPLITEVKNHRNVQPAPLTADSTHLNIIYLFLVDSLAYCIVLYSVMLMLSCSSGGFSFSDKMRKWQPGRAWWSQSVTQGSCESRLGLGLRWGDC